MRTMEADGVMTVVATCAPHNDERCSRGRADSEIDGTKAAIMTKLDIGGEDR